jgi:hypothetical protein
LQQKNERIIALFCADMHWSLNPPVWRTAEPNWLEAQLRPLEELKKLQDKHNCPIFCAGDLFDKWNSPAELINWAMEYSPYMHAIPGQHDLPEHNINEIGRSAYWTLVKASVIHDIKPNDPDIGAFVDDRELIVNAFPYGKRIQPIKNGKLPHFNVAMIHEYNWIKGHGYPNALLSCWVSAHRACIRGYNLIVSGDNHSPFYTQVQNTLWWNCGAFIRRKSDEKDYKPRIGMLTESGKMVPHYLDTSQDKYVETADVKDGKSGFQIDELMAQLGNLGEACFDFRAAVEQYMRANDTDARTKTILLKAMEGRKR